VALGLEDGSFEPRALSPDEAARDWVEWPLPPIGPEETRRLLDFEDDAALASFRGVLVFRVKEKALWGIKAAIASAVTLVPAVLAIAAAASGDAAWGLRATAWLGIFAAVEAIHLAELPAALRAWKKDYARRALPWTRARAVRAVVGTLGCGYPSWVPRKLGVFD